MAKTLIGNVKGPPGVTPHIGENGNWWIGETDTGVAATAGAEAAQAAAAAAKTSETNAKTSETNAGNSANAAAASEQSASTNAGYAESEANKAIRAADAAEDAQEAAETAQAAAEAAKADAEKAKTDAEAAKESAEEARIAAEDAELGAENAKTAAASSASKAATSETNAASSASSASSSKTAAANSATTATNAANEAKGYRDEVKNMLDNAEVDPANAVLVTAQSLTDPQKAQARDNIDAVGKAELFDLSPGGNYADMSTLKDGLLHTNGTVYTGGSYDNYCYLECYIPVDEGDVVSLQFTRTSTGVRYWNVNKDYPYADNSFVRVTAYDANKNVLSDLGHTGHYNYTTPAGVKFIRVSFSKPLFYSTDDNVRGKDFSIVKNATSIMPYEEYGSFTYSTIKKEHLPSSLDSKSTVYVSLPDTVHVKTGNTFNVYFRNIISRNDVMLWIGYHNNLTTHYYDEYATILASAEGEFDLPWKVYDMGGNLLESGTLTVIATSKVPIDTTTAMVIGDSTVNDGTMTAKVRDLYNADGAVLSLLGTRGGGTHEGRGGWTAKSYCTVASSGDIANPFYNNGFDFSYYMNTQGFSGVQAVAIQLGINDVFQFKDYSWAPYDSESVLGYINQMVTSILAYNPSIKVIINLPITPNSNGTSFTETYGTTQLYWYYNRNIIRFAKELKDYFKTNSRVTISASNCILDTKTQIRDGVHPTADGYNALGQRLYEVLVSIVDGEVVVVPLLDISLRTFVEHQGATLSATSKRALDVTKCYKTTFNGSRAQNSIITKYQANGADSLSIQASTAGGTGVEFPVALEAGKTYTIKYTVNNTGRGYLVKYNADTTYASNTNWSTAAGTFTKSFTAEEGYLYSIFFCPMVKDTLVTFSGISLTEN